MSLNKREDSQRVRKRRGHGCDTCGKDHIDTPNFYYVTVEDGFGNIRCVRTSIKMPDDEREYN